jgi:drug/metabolite transporter (DMT)-like permease
VPVRPRHRTAAIVAVAAATVVWGSVGVFVKSTSLSGVTFAMYRLWLGVLVHLIALAVTRRRLSWATFRACAPGGALFAVDISLGFTAVKLTTVANAAIIGALSPILITLVAARMFGERPGRREVGLIALSFLGVAIVAVGGSGSPAWSPVGDLLALAATVSWTAYWLFSKRARAEVSALEYMTSVMIAAALTVTPLALLVGGMPPTPPTPRDWTVIVAVALLPGMTGHLLVAWSHRHVESWLSALITQCSPVISAGMAWPVLGEPLTPLVVAGGLVVVASTAIVIVSASRRERERARVAEAEAEIEPVTELPA